MPKSAKRKIAKRRTKKPKQGRQYELAVRDLYRTFYPSAAIEAGEWVVGPDGRRELDVRIKATENGRVLRGIVECKDFNPATTGPVGIQHVDALESKRRDLGADFSMMCSNAGFTKDAVNKARRVGIGLIGALRRDDERIRFQITEELYTRLLQITSVSMNLYADDSEINLTGVTPESIRCGEQDVLPWAIQRSASVIALHPIVQGGFSLSHGLIEPTRFDWPGGSATVTRFQLNFEIKGAWFVQQVKFASTGAIYDWIRRRNRMAPGAGQLQLVDVNYAGGEWVSRPPQIDWRGEKFLVGESELRFTLFVRQDPMRNTSNLDPLFVREDLALNIEGEIPEECSLSIDRDAALALRALV